MSNVLIRIAETILEVIVAVISLAIASLVPA